MKDPQRARQDWSSFLAATDERLEAKLKSAKPGADVLRIVAEEAWSAGDDVILPLAIPVLAPGMVSLRILNTLMEGKVPGQTVTLFASALEGNVVTEMDAVLGELAESARPSPALVDAIAIADLENVVHVAKTDEAGGPFMEHWEQFIQRYGQRGPGEIDIARPRWRDEPKSLLHVISGILQDKPHAQRRRLSEAKAASVAAEQELIQAAGRGILGILRRPLVRWLIRWVRGYMAMREHHKFWIIQLWGRLCTALLDTGAMAVKNGWLKKEHDVFMLRIDELRGEFDVVNATTLTGDDAPGNNAPG
ncbi:MAG: hypothetical protein GY822_16185, partial [Deltaproteobacteria bacterium]|nr:hypothetical protein [Deltaproteobacteria bacterium]